MVGYRPEMEQRLSEFQLGAAGAVSGAVTRAATQPLDVLKIRFQLQVEPVRGPGSKKPGGKYRGVLQATRTVLAEEGLSALWKGHIPAQGLSLIYGAMQFYTYETLTRHAHELGGYCPSAPLVHFLCGATAGAAATIFSHPLDVIRTRLVAQAEPKIYRGVTHALSSMVSQEGFFSLYRGLSPSLLLVAPQMGAMFAFYRSLTDLWHALWPGTHSAFICGALAGVGAKTLVYPLDLAKKRLQIRGFEHARRGFGQVVVFEGLGHVLWDTIKREGFTALFKGLWPSMLKAATTTGLQLAVYEHTCVLFLSFS